MDQTLVSRNNAFLAAVGLIESESRGRWRLTDSGIIVAQAFEYDAAEELQIALSSTLRANDFIQGILTLVRTRGGVEESQLVPQIARMAGTPRKTEFLTGSRTLLELMLAAGLVVIEGGVFRLGSRPESRTGWIDEPGADDTTQSAEPALSRTSAIARTAHVVINLNLSADDLESDERVQALTARIRRLLDSVEQMSREDAD